MAVNNVRVRQIINDAIARASNNGDPCCGSIRQAWINLKAWRDLPPAAGAQPNSLDLDVAAAEKRALEAGPYEFSVTGSYVSRSIDREGRFNEYDAILARPVRLPGKARLDRKAGALGVEAATNHFEDARHQAALLLNALWWDWVGASAEAVVDAQGVENYATLVRIVRRRVDLRDAPQLEADQAGAALAEARQLAAQSAGRADLARARLAAQFPGVALPVQAPTLATPAFDPAGASQMRDQVIERSHEIAAADAEAERERREEAQRAGEGHA